MVHYCESLDGGEAVKRFGERPQRMATDECDCMNVCMYVIKYEK
jgi:hypothetical protein